ncbi:MAG: hypothetical protein NC311_17010, partial [Muribaculaceae bacterium]|nr:hypothetical protein [Muribaculaceae bacterium]
WFKDKLTALNSSTVSLTNYNKSAMSASELGETQYSQIFTETIMTDDNNQQCYAKSECNNTNGWYASARDSNVGSNYITAVSKRSYHENQVEGGSVAVKPDLGLTSVTSAGTSNATFAATESFIGGSANTSSLIQPGIGGDIFERVSYTTSSGTQSCYKTWECPSYKCPDGYFSKGEAPEGYKTTGSGVSRVCSLDSSVKEPETTQSSSDRFPVNSPKCYLKTAKTCTDYGYQSSQTAGASCTPHSVKLGDKTDTCYSCFFDKVTVNVTISGNLVGGCWETNAEYTTGPKWNGNCPWFGNGSKECALPVSRTDTIYVKAEQGNPQKYTLTWKPYYWVPIRERNGLRLCSDACVCKDPGSRINKTYTIDGTEKEVTVRIIAQPCIKNDEVGQCCGKSVGPGETSDIVGCSGNGGGSGGDIGLKPNQPYQ